MNNNNYRYRSSNSGKAESSARLNSAMRKQRNAIRVKTVMVVILAIISAMFVVAAALGVTVLLYKPHTDDITTDNPAIGTGENADGADDEEKSKTEKLIRKDGTYNFLVLGKDIVGLNTDIIMLANFSVEDGSISILQIPRDTYIKIDGEAHKINSVYSIMYRRALNDGDENPSQSGISDMAAVLESNLGVKIDYYALVNLKGFGNIVDLIGGIPMNVPYDMDYEDPEQDLYIHIKAGQQVLDGEKAQQFIRFRSGYITGDIGRIDAQKLFLTAAIQQLKNNINLNTILGLIGEFCDNVDTSLSVSDMTFFAKEFYLISDAKISFITFPGQDVYSGGRSYYIMKRNDMYSLLNSYFNVYTSDIADETFDEYAIFTNSSSSEISEIYNSTLSTDLSEYVRSVSAIEDNGISIPLKN